MGEAQALADAIDTHLAINALAVTINEIDEDHSLWNTVAYFASRENAEEAQRLLHVAGATIDPIPDVDWVRESLRGLAPVTAGRFMLHGSHDRAIRRAGGLSLEIDAGTAFGTGHHGTTAGCLLILDALLKKHRPRRIFDLGCGTGVLALAAAKATRTKVLATDIDPEAVRVTKRNAVLNGVGPWVQAQTAAGLHHPIIRRNAPYDLIFANILARPLAAMAQGLAELLAAGGVLILSGLTRDQQRWISACYRQRGLISTQTISHGNWIAFSVTKKTKRRKAASRRFAAMARGPGWSLDA